MAEIKFSPEAITDLQQTKAYITEELCNEQAAVGTLAKITKRIRQLSDFPESGAPLSSIVDFERITVFWSAAIIRRFTESKIRQ